METGTIANLDATKPGTGNEDSDEFLEQVCEPCTLDGENVIAEGYCQDCREYLCAPCYKVHCRPSVTRHHVLLGKNDMPHRKPVGKVNDVCTEGCLKHEHKIVEYYCRTHELLGCSVCMTTRHRACEHVDYIPDVAAELDQGRELAEMSEELDEILTDISVGESKLGSNTKAIYINSKMAISKVKQLRKEVDALFDKLETATIDEVNELKAKDEQNIFKMTDQINIVSEKVKHLKKDLEQTRTDKQFCKLFLMLKRNRTDIQTLKEETEAILRKNTIRRYEFVPGKNVTDLKDTLREFGELVVKESSVRVAASAASVGIKCEDDQNTPNISGIQLLSQNYLVAIDSTNKAIKLVDISDSKIVCKYKLERDPWDVTKINNTKVAITFPNENMVELLDVNEKYEIVPERVIDAIGNCYGIAYSDDRLYLTFNNPGSVRVLDLEGHTLFTFPQQFGVPWYVDVSPCRRNVYVADTGQNSVTAVDIEGKVKATFKDESILGIRGLTTDKSGSVYVCGWGSNNVIKMTSYCSKEQVLQDGALRLARPYSVTYCDVSERLFIGMSNEHIRVIQFH